MQCENDSSEDDDCIHMGIESDAARYRLRSVTHSGSAKPYCEGKQRRGRTRIVRMRVAVMITKTLQGKSVSAPPVELLRMPHSLVAPERESGDFYPHLSPFGGPC